MIINLASLCSVTNVTNANDENVKCEYKDNTRYVEVDGQGKGHAISNKELFEMYPY